MAGLKEKYAGIIPAERFPLASLYAQLGEPAGLALREPRPPAVKPFPYTERHVQCVWFDPRLRPTDLSTDAGEPLIVDSPGTWNSEAGPDFRDAVLRVGPEQRRIVCDVEIHIHAADWKHHGHGSDTRYDDVRCHVTWFPGTLSPREMPQGTMHVSLQAPLSKQAGFSFEHVDVSSYPLEVASSPANFRIFEGWTAQEKGKLLDAAGQERLRHRAERFALLIRERGADQAVYEEVMAALGFKHNKLPFRTLAQRLPLAVLREECRDAETAYAYLLGVSGWLPETLKPGWDDETRTYVRGLWDAWWKQKDRFASRTMHRDDWSRIRGRPANHPSRRLMAAAALFTREPTPHSAWLNLADRHGPACLENAIEALQILPGGYWDRRLSLGGKVQDATAACIGKGRAAAIAVNVLVPYLAAMGAMDAIHTRILEKLPPDDESGLVRKTAALLFGPDHSASHYRTGLRRQGLIQIYHDFCLNDRSHEVAAAFPEALRKT